MYERWDISVNSDGTCSAVNTATGFVNYSHDYTGTWIPISDEVIKIDMVSETHGARVTQSNFDVDHEANKAQTRWKRNQVYSNSGELQAGTRIYEETFYIRNDGATSRFADGLDSPLMKCN